jgi:hypothetical protein
VNSVISLGGQLPEGTSDKGWLEIDDIELF